MDRKYLLTAFGYGIIGLILGIYMASSKNHSQMVTHAHIMLLGFVVSFIYGMTYKVWIREAPARFVAAQYYLHQVGTLGLVLGLFLLYGGFAAEAVVGPALGVSSILALSGMLLMKFLFIKSTSRAVAPITGVQEAV